MTDLSEDFKAWWMTIPQDVRIHHHNVYMLSEAFEAGRRAGSSGVDAVEAYGEPIPDHLICLANSRWGRRLAADIGPETDVFFDILEAAYQKKPVVISKTNELYGDDQYMYAIRLEGDPEFWLDAFDALNDALKLCEEMGWPVVRQPN